MTLNNDILRLQDVECSYGGLRSVAGVSLSVKAGETVALIVDYIYREDLNVYLWTVICQQCGDYQVEIRDTDADLFVKSHNRICGPVIFEEKDR
jgi:hypothetical protein